MVKLKGNKTSTKKKIIPKTIKIKRSEFKKTTTIKITIYLLK
jgi:hypothetical protein